VAEFNRLVKDKGGKGKIQCRNSHERQTIHTLAEESGLSHRSVINYREIHINETMGKIRNSDCCRDCDGYLVTLSATPMSYVEIGNGCDKITIGLESWVPGTQTFQMFSTYDIKREKDNMKRQHLEAKQQ